LKAIGLPIIPPPWPTVRRELQEIMQKKLTENAPVIEMRATDELVPYARNARTHSEEQIRKIARSISEFGFTNPVLINEEGTIIAGHGRVLAAQRLGLEKVPVIVVRGWSEEQLRAYVIADNQLALEAGWDEELLKLELSFLEFDASIDLTLTGFNDADLAKLLTKAVEEEAGVDHAEEWQGMPEFEQKDKTAFRSITLHFKDQDAVEALADLIGQRITDKTRFIWYPSIELETYADKRYASGS